MNGSGWIQLLLYVGLLALLTKPAGAYLCRVLTPDGRTHLEPVLGPVERLLYRIFRVDAQSEQDWKQYSLSLLMFSLAGMMVTYAILRLQNALPLNSQHLAAVGNHLSFNTAASFTTNTNWQSYAGEAVMSYFSQMVALASHNFFSAAVGIAVAAALVRGISRATAKTIGNFWVDLVRVNLYLLLPGSLMLALMLVSQGMIQNFKPYAMATVVQTTAADSSTAPVQSIVQGPMASQVAIKMLGTNGGGYTNANASHPYENPTPLSNFLQMLSIFLIPAGLTYYLGRMVKSQQHGWAVWIAMALLFLGGVFVAWHTEAGGNPRLSALGIDPAGGNMEGKEVRFGIFNSALFATITTDASCGAVNATHDSFTPLGGLVPLFNIQLGEVVFGGVGSGLYGMLLYVILAIFIAGLMVGRTPEYLGKKIGASEVKLAAIGILVPVVSTLGLTAWAVMTKWGVAGLNNSGPHGLAEILYAFSSGTGNNGSAFAGLATNTPWYNTLLGLAMLAGRFMIIVPVLALAGNLAARKSVPLGPGSFPVTGPTFILLLIGTVVIVGALTFLPVLALGPVLEHFQMMHTAILY
ncbi:MAG TPA: potassium-transporting ATPase subunit KdpA [bacterium]|jgi:K+-transporting ATPase ATPase A chain